MNITINTNSNYNKNIGFGMFNPSKSVKEGINHPTCPEDVKKIVKPVLEELDLAIKSIQLAEKGDKNNIFTLKSFGKCPGENSAKLTLEQQVKVPLKGTIGKFFRRWENKGSEEINVQDGHIVEDIRAYINRKRV